MISSILFFIVIVATAVLIHYEFLYRLSRISSAIRIRQRFRVALGVIGAIIAHSVEIGLFAGVYYFLNNLPGWGHLQGNFNGNFQDCMYFSFTTFTTLGFGDIEPFGHIRLLTGMESLTGLVLITWSASFLYYEMQTNWKNHD